MPKELRKWELTEEHTFSLGREMETTVKSDLQDKLARLEDMFAIK
jgi:hypothetical protein